jgi:thiol-disulfide isomerase/thioredoxin
MVSLRTNRFLPALAALALAFPALAAPPASVHVPFLEGKPFADVLKRARAEKKPVLIDVVAEWCGPCKMMDRTTFADPAVVEWARKVVPARFDAEKGEGRKIAARYAVRSFPTVIFVDADGNEIDRLLGAFGPPEFKTHGESIVTGKNRLAEALAKLKKTFSYDEAYGLVRSLADRNDLPRARPLAVRIVSEDPDFGRPETLDTLVLLAALEDIAEKVTPETEDLISTYLPRLGQDSRRGVLSVILAREEARRGDAAGAKATVTQALQALGESNAYATDLLIALGNAQKSAGQLDAAVATYKRAAAAGQNAPRSLQAFVEMNMAEALAAAGKAQEARTAVASALQKSGEEPAALARAAKVAILLKDPKDAVAKARRAVGLSQGEDAESQAALAQALAASGDASGAAEAWKRAGEIDPQNAEVQKHLKTKKGGPAKTS